MITKWTAGHRSREGSLANQQPEHTERAFLQQNGTKSTVFRPTQLLLEHQSTNSRPTYTGCAWEVRMTRAETVHCTTTFFKTPQPQDNITDAQSTAALNGCRSTKYVRKCQAHTALAAEKRKHAPKVTVRKTNTKASRKNNSKLYHKIS